MDMIVKRRALFGFDEGDDKHCTVLNRMIDREVTRSGEEIVHYECDPRHVDLLLKATGLDSSIAKDVSTLGEKKGDFHDLSELKAGAATTFRSGTTRLVHIASDLQEFEFAPTD